MSEKGSTIRGLSIAVTCLSALSIVFALGVAGLSGMLGIAIAQDDFTYSSPSPRYHQSMDAGGLGLSPSEIRELRSLGVDVEDLQLDFDEITSYDIAGITMVLMLFGAFAMLVSSALTLVAGILGIVRSKKPDKMQAVFIWAIVGAVFAFFAGRIITLVLLIILAIEANRYRKEYGAMLAADGPAFE